MDVRPVRSRSEIVDAAKLMCGLVEANKALYNDDVESVEKYYRGSWFFNEHPEIPTEYCSPHGDVLLAYLGDDPAGTVAICRMDDHHCELKSMFVSPEHRRKGVAVSLCEAVISLARSQGYHTVRLRTGVRQTEARLLYQQLEFKPVTPWDVNPLVRSLYFELVLS